MMSLRWYAVAAAALVLIGSLRIISTYRVFSHTIDEPDNLAAGMEYVSTGRYLYHDENPPLARLFSAIGPFLAGERYHPGPNAHLEGARRRPLLLPFPVERRRLEFGHERRQPF